MNVEKVRDSLLKILPSELGTYTIDGQFTPAIAILSTGQSLPNDRACEGLEIIIRREPERKSQVMYGNVLQTKIWTVFVSQWDGEYKMQDAIAKIIEQFPTTKLKIVPINEQKGIREQFELKITDFD